MNVPSRSRTIGLGYKGGRTPYLPFDITTLLQDKEKDLKIRKVRNQAKGVASGRYLEGRGGRVRKGRVNRDGWKVLKRGGDGDLDQPRGGLGLEWQPGRCK